MISLPWLNSTAAFAYGSSAEDALDPDFLHGRPENVTMTVPHHSGSGYGATLNEPNRHGWGGETILALAVAEELNKTAEMRSPLETGPSVDRAAAATMTPGREPVSYLPPIPPPADRNQRPSFVALQEWEGVVTEINDGNFSARLVDLTHSNPDEESEFSKTEISDDDVDLVVPGALFRWSVGVLRMPGGAKRPTSQVVFRRLPQWTKRDLERADIVAKDLVKKFENINDRRDPNESRSRR
jgi:hypothetical protein